MSFSTLRYRVTVVYPERDSVNNLLTSETAAFRLARSIFTNRVDVYHDGIRIATKEPGSDRLIHLKGATK